MNCFQKRKIEEQIFRFRETHDSWPEPMREWIIEAENAPKVAGDVDLEAKRFWLKNSARTLP